MRAIGKACGAPAGVERQFGDNAKEALASLRAGAKVKDIDESIDEMIFTVLISRDHKATHAVDVLFRWQSPGCRQSTQFRFLEKKGQLEEDINKWLNTHETLLASNEICLALMELSSWQLPTTEELQSLGWISKHPIPASFGPSPPKQALEKFAEGDIQGCATIFAKMLLDREEPATRNDLGFCQIIVGDVTAGRDNVTKAAAAEYEPLYELNKGIAIYLQGDIEPAKECLRHALKELRSSDNEYVSVASYVLLLDPLQKKATANQHLTVEMAILINLYRMGESEAEIRRLAPQEAEPVLASTEPTTVGGT
jgi:hypothetical protein